MSEWQPIKTAPKDGTPIRVLLESTVAYEEHIPAALMGGWKRQDSHDKIVGWMPLPYPPSLSRDCPAPRGETS
jgi:hypothetical protein